MLIFWIGTVAELIKVFTVIMEARRRGLPYVVIATGQNQLSGTDVLRACNDDRVDLVLSDTVSIRKSAFGLFCWFVSTYVAAKKVFRKVLAERHINQQEAVLVVHGDTVSTLMGAWLARREHIRLAHVEAGLRSFDLFRPFPEEIDRMLVSRNVMYHFCPGDEAEANLRRAKARVRVVNTHGNTIYDALRYADEVPASTYLESILASAGKRYFVFVMHRQENVADRRLFASTVRRVADLSKNIHCVFVLHEITRAAVERDSLMPLLDGHTFTLIGRTGYFDFMKILRRAEFVITDGGSNQEELACMGKPCLIMRTKTERPDGLGRNAVLCNNDFSVFDAFVNDYKHYEFPSIALEESPSSVIVDVLEKSIGNDPRGGETGA